MSPRASVAGIPAYALFQSAPVLFPDPEGVTVWQAAKAEGLARQKTTKRTSSAFNRHCICNDRVFLSFDDTMIDSPIRDARICSLLETEGEATGVSVANGKGARICSERAHARPVPKYSQTVIWSKLLQILTF